MGWSTFELLGDNSFSAFRPPRTEQKQVSGKFLTYLWRGL